MHQGGVFTARGWERGMGMAEDTGLVPSSEGRRRAAVLGEALASKFGLT